MRAADRAAFLGHRDEQLARTTILKHADRDVTLVSSHAELVGDALPSIRQTLTAWLALSRFFLFRFCRCRASY